MFYFWGTAELFLKENTYMGDWAVKNWLTNYTAFDEPFWIKSTKPGNHHYRVRPGNGGFYITTVRMIGVDKFGPR